MVTIAYEVGDGLRYSALNTLSHARTQPGQSWKIAQGDRLKPSHKINLLATQIFSTIEQIIRSTIEQIIRRRYKCLTISLHSSDIWSTTLETKLYSDLPQFLWAWFSALVLTLSRAAPHSLWEMTVCKESGKLCERSKTFRR